MNKICSVKGCKNSYRLQKYNNTNKIYCCKHRHHLERYGRILKETRFDKNIIIIKKNYAEIVLKNKHFKEIGRAKIDLEDVNIVKKYKWNYGTRCVNNNVVGKLHNFLMGKKAHRVIDHTNRSFLDNRRKNLRFISQRLNTCNTKISKNNTSGVVGVRRFRNGKWVATIWYKYTSVHLGYFINFEDAVAARKKAELKYFGEIIDR